MQHESSNKFGSIEASLTSDRFLFWLLVLVSLNILVYGFLFFWPKQPSAFGCLSPTQQAAVAADVAEKERVLGLSCEALQSESNPPPHSSAPKPEGGGNNPPTDPIPPDNSGPEGGFGSGFFISDNVVVTNCHVIEGAPESVGITSKSLGGILTARVIAKACEDIGGNDFALLEITKPRKTKGVLPIAHSTKKLAKVWSYGYPGIALQAETFDTPPDLIPTNGRIRSVNKRDTSSELLYHDAEISPGNSGGPLVDECGNVVGVNTFLIPDGPKAADYALSSTMLRRFLDDQNIDDYEFKERCSPTGVLSDEALLTLAERSVVWVFWSNEK